MIIFATFVKDGFSGPYWKIKHIGGREEEYSVGFFERKYELSLGSFGSETTMIEPDGTRWSAYKLKLLPEIYARQILTKLNWVWFPLGASSVTGGIRGSYFELTDDEFCSNYERCTDDPIHKIYVGKCNIKWEFFKLKSTV